MSNSDLIRGMLASGFVQSERIADAFQNIDRSDFVGDRNQPFAYDDRPLEIGLGQTISQPSVVAFMLEHLGTMPGDKVLDIGSGSGWTTALLAYLAGQEGRVLGLERVPELVRFGRSNLEKYHFINASVKLSLDLLGAPGRAPFDRIMVSAEAATVPITLLDQLKAGGSLVIPIGSSIEVIHKASDGSLDHEAHPGFIFVPLI